MFKCWDLGLLKTENYRKKQIVEEKKEGQKVEVEEGERKGKNENLGEE